MKKTKKLNYYLGRMRKDLEERRRYYALDFLIELRKFSKDDRNRDMAQQYIADYQTWKDEYCRAFHIKQKDSDRRFPK